MPAFHFYTKTHIWQLNVKFYKSHVLLSTKNATFEKSLLLWSLGSYVLYFVMVTSYLGHGNLKIALISIML